MDEIEFRKRVDADPDNIDQETLDAAAANPSLQGILERSRRLNSRLHELVDQTSVPGDLKARLLAIPEQEEAPARPAGRAWYFQYYAVAACLIMAVGVGFVVGTSRAPSAAEIVFGNQVIEHLYHEEAEIDAINNGTLQRSFAMPAINQVMANSGSRFNQGAFLNNMTVRYANPCLVAEPFNSSHLILQTSQGAINVITVDNSPVSREFVIEDDRFRGVVIPMNGGNLILVGEKDQNLGEYRPAFEEDMEWVI